MSKHTPGPWKSDWTNDVGPDDDYYIEFFEILDSQHKRIGTAEKEADASLIAATPDLLNAVRFLLSNPDNRISMADFNVANAAIAKALGEM